MIIYNNIPAMQTAFALNQTNESLQNDLQQLSTGLRINKAADDAAGLAITSEMGNAIDGMNQASLNLQSGINMVQTADGAAGQINSILDRLQTLANEAANNTLTTGDRGDIQKEVNQLMTDINHIATSTKFNGVRLLTGGLATGSNMKIQVGAYSTDTVKVSIAKMTVTGLFSAGAINNGTVSVGTVSAANKAITYIQNAVNSLATDRAGLGAAQNALQYLSNNLQTSLQNLTASQASLQDTDMATEMADFTRQQILEQSGTAMLAQANALPQTVLKLLG